MKFKMENGTYLKTLDTKEILKKLATLNGTTNSYAILEKDYGSYIQVGGGPLQFTVEVRKILSDGGFLHKKAGKLEKTNNIAKLIISGSVVELRSYQVLEIEIVNRLFSSFVKGEYFSRMVDWEDITTMFL